MNTKHFPRPALAAAFADELMGKTPLSDAPNGLFIAGERRTGKSQFMRLDLKPMLEQRGLLVLYVDLKANVKLPSLEAMQQALHQAVQENLGAVAKFAKSTGLDKIGVPGAFGIDLRSIGKTDGLSLYQVLDVLHKATKKQIVLIVDEAQHALTSDGGEALMWALKSARDQMKTTIGSDLMLVMSGSHTDKLTLLLNSPKTPFWGSQVRGMPKLDDDFVLEYAAQISTSRPEFSTVRSSEMVKAFEHFGRRPQFFVNAVGRAAASSHDASGFEQMLVAESQMQTQADRQRFTDMFLALSKLEQAVLERLIVQGKAFRAFDANALAFYSERLSGVAIHAKTKVKAIVSATQVQRAIDALRENEEELVWQSTRGEYSIYDQGLIAWHTYLVAQREWPPTQK
jgi:hypothetical protein